MGSPSKDAIESDNRREFRASPHSHVDAVLSDRARRRVRLLRCGASKYHGDHRSHQHSLCGAAVLSGDGSRTKRGCKLAMDAVPLAPGQPWTSDGRCICVRPDCGKSTEITPFAAHRPSSCARALALRACRHVAGCRTRFAVCGLGTRP